MRFVKCKEGWVNVDNLSQIHYLNDPENEQRGPWMIIGSPIGIDLLSNQHFVLKENMNSKEECIEFMDTFWDSLK
jgi:hypothetical protein